MPVKKHPKRDILKGHHGALSGKDKFVPRRLVEIRPDLCPDILRPASRKSEPFDYSFVSETPTTITIRHRDGEILTVPKVPYADVLKRLKREKSKRKRKPVDTGATAR